jgi:hypothetical protein
MKYVIYELRYLSSLEIKDKESIGTVIQKNRKYYLYSKLYLVSKNDKNKEDKIKKDFEHNGGFLLGGIKGLEKIAEVNDSFILSDGNERLVYSGFNKSPYIKGLQFIDFTNP